MEFLKTWTDDRVDELKRHWETGSSCSVIGVAMGVSRNSIIGKIHRLGLIKRGIKVSQAELFSREQRRQARNARRVINQRNSRRQLRGDIPMQELPPAPEPFAGSLNLPFNDLRPFSHSEPNECRFIADGGPDYLACGTLTLPGKSYCGHCSVITYYRAINITDAEREQRSRQATKNWKAAEVKLSGTAEVAVQ